MRICCLTPLDRRGPWTAPEYGCASWCLALGADFFPYAAEDLAPLEAYDLLVLHTSMALYPRILHVLERFAHKALVLQLTCDAMYIDPQGFFPGFALPLKALLDRAALAISESEEVGFFQAMTPTPVVHLPLPVPLAAMRSAAISGCGSRVADCQATAGPPASSIRSPQSEIRNGPLVLLGSALRPKKNGLATALAFQRLRQRGWHPQRPPAVEGGSRDHPQARTLEGATHAALGVPRAIVFAEEPEAERAAYRLWGIEGIEVRPLCGQPAYWRQLAACGLALHLDYRRTVGRFSAECAALGVPCISTAGASMQRTCFPDLMVEPWDVAAAAALAERLLGDPMFRDRVLAKAALALEPLDLAPMAARFREILDRFVA